ncbi:hypothetical protein AQUSIP_13200 [Aquicella siphonis]|uniref:Uncharacterized protein n=1 Tax=Aquicella siphonis TaxID=254247 RepID=A0A5E4PGD6_9COXI|nr:hypothetical protein [Aquicella siphonis]VVC76019.1 hypothetical protein AQUSIP_13200 [Aquicella siphonis]
MPLLPGKKNIGHNIQVEEKSGAPHDQAVAIALREANIKSENTCHPNGGELDAAMNLKPTPGVNPFEHPESLKPFNPFPEENKNKPVAQDKNP